MASRTDSGLKQRRVAPRREEERDLLSEGDPENKLIDLDNIDGEVAGAPDPRDIQVPLETARLFHFDEVPSWLRDNPHIFTGYRARYTAKMCFQSLFQLHNETLNVWTHGIGIILYLCLYPITMAFVVKPDVSHYFIFTVFSIGCIACMACSSIFHLFTAHYSNYVYDWMHTLDFFGITILTVTSCYPMFYYMFECNDELRYGYMAMISVLGLAGIIGPLFQFFHSDAFFWPRLAVYVSIVVSGIIPTVHAVGALPLNESTIPLLEGVALMFLLYGLGVLVYASRFPECMMPGRFDYFFASHQIWHCFVLCSSIVHFFTCVGLYQQWELMKGHC